MTVIGLVLCFLSAIGLLYYSFRTEGATTIADKDRLISPWFYRICYILLAIGFLLQVLGAIVCRQ